MLDDVVEKDQIVGASPEIQVEEIADQHRKPGPRTRGLRGGGVPLDPIYAPSVPMQQFEHSARATPDFDRAPRIRTTGRQLVEQPVERPLAQCA